MKIPPSDITSCLTGGGSHKRAHEACVATLFCLLLTGCATGPTVPAVVKIPVAQSCIKDAPEKPATQDESAIKAMDDFAATLTVWTERLLLKAYAERAEAVIAACR